MASGMSGTRPVVVGIGEILWDLLPAGKQLGGAPANFAYHAAALGAEALPVSCVGQDPLGYEILDRLDRLQLSRSCLAMDPAHPTGTVQVRLDARGVPEFIIQENVAWDFIPWSQALAELAARADAVCFGSLAQRSSQSRRTIWQFLHSVRKGCLRVFDINLRQQYFDRQIIQDSLASSDVLKLNDAELPVLARLVELDGDEATIIRELLHRYPLRMVALTLGERGSRLYTTAGMFQHDGCPAKVADTVGAGDAFAAALTMGLLHNQDPQQINRRANVLASYVCTQPGATPPIPPGLLD